MRSRNRLILSKIIFAIFPYPWISIVLSVVTVLLSVVTVVVSVVTVPYHWIAIVVSVVTDP